MSAACGTFGNARRATTPLRLSFLMKRWRHSYFGSHTNRKTASRRSLRNPIRCFDQAAIAAPFCLLNLREWSLVRVCALGLTISLPFKLEPSFRWQLISVLLSEGNRCIRLRSRLPAHCVRFGTRTGWACWVAFTSRPGPLPAKRHDHNTASSIWAMPCPVCHSLNARVIIANASTCPLAVSSCVGFA